MFDLLSMLLMFCYPPRYSLILLLFYCCCYCSSPCYSAFSLVFKVNLSLCGCPWYDFFLDFPFFFYLLRMKYNFPTTPLLLCEKAFKKAFYFLHQVHPRAILVYHIKNKMKSVSVEALEKVKGGKCLKVV